MKICILTHTFPKNINDSTSSFMHTLSLGLQKAGSEIIVLTPYSPQLKNNNFPYRVISYKYIWPNFLHTLGYGKTLKDGSKMGIRTYFLSLFLFLFGIIALINVCRREKIDVISAHWILPNGFIAFVASKLLKIPYTITLCGSDIYMAKKNVLFSKMAVICANSASFVAADSPKFLSDLITLGAKVQKNNIIPYPVNADRFNSTTKGVESLRKKLNLEKDNLIILAVGRLIYKKGFEYLIKSLSGIAKQYPKTRLVIVGDGDLKKQLKDLAFKLNLENKINFVGVTNRNDITIYYNLANIFVMPSIKDRDGNMDDQPVSLIEAMACGKPIIATDFPGIRLTVKNKINGFLIPEKNISMITRALEELIKSQSLRKKMGQESRKIVLKNLTDKKIGENYTSIFRNIIENR